MKDPRYIENCDRSRKCLQSSYGGYEKCGMVREVFIKSQVIRLIVSEDTIMVASPRERPSVLLSMGLSQCSGT